MSGIDNYLAKRSGLRSSQERGPNTPRVRGFDGLAELLQQQDDARRAQRVRSKRRRSHSSSHGTESSTSKSCDCRPGKLFLASGWPEICPRCGELLRFSIG